MNIGNIIMNIAPPPNYRVGGATDARLNLFKFKYYIIHCVFIFRIANTFVASYAMKDSEIIFVIRKFLPDTPQLFMLATALALPLQPRMQDSLFNT